MKSSLSHLTALLLAPLAALSAVEPAAQLQPFMTAREPRRIEAIVRGRQTDASPGHAGGPATVLLTLINYSTGSYSDVTIALSDKLGKMKWIEISETGKERHCQVSRTGSEYEMKPGSEIPSLGVKFFAGK